MNEFFKSGGFYCAHCVGNKDKHTDQCPVPDLIKKQQEQEMEDKQ